MENLSQLRERYLDYNKNQMMGQRGGGNYDTDSESETEDRPYMVQGTVENPNKLLLKETHADIMKNKSDFYNTVMPKAPSPLDQSIILNTILETDMATIAQVLIEALSNFNSRFNTSLMDVYNRNNRDLSIKPEDIETYKNLINEEANKCILMCRGKLRSFNKLTKNQNIDDCKNMIEEIFVTYVYTQYNPKVNE